MRLFAGDRIYKILDKLGAGEGEPIEHSMLTKRIEGAQKRVEEHNFEIRKNVLKYDDVLNKQRGVVYEQRQRVLERRGHLRPDPRVDRRGRWRASSRRTPTSRSPRSGTSTG